MGFADWADERLEYDRFEDIEHPGELEIDEIEYETIEKSCVGHSRHEYSVEAVSKEGRRYEVSVADSGSPGFGSIIRATPLNDEEVVYRGRSIRDPQMALAELDEPLDGSTLERSY
jgi:hypothetical protein